jgi:hypothetical protein
MSNRHAKEVSAAFSAAPDKKSWHYTIPNRS